MKKAEYGKVTLGCIALMGTFFISYLELYPLGDYIHPIVMAVLAIIYMLFFQYKKANSRYFMSMIQDIIIFICIYELITYIAGIFTSFYANPLNGDYQGIVIKLIIESIYIVAYEFIRYVLIKKSGNSFWLYLLIIFTFITADIWAILPEYNPNRLSNWIYIALFAIIPGFANNSLLTYISLKTGPLPCILYSGILLFVKIIIPYHPDFGMYIGGIISIVAPLLFLLALYEIDKKKDRSSLYYTSPTVKIVERTTLGVLVAVIVVIVSLTSNAFRYGTLTIGSGSMTGTINKGDVVLVKHLKEKEKLNLQEGEIIAFHEDGVIIVHRIIRITDMQDGTHYFFTKGDFNNAEDGRPIVEKDIIGTVSQRIPYLGWPTVLVNELLH
ncbi:MAG: signal peptidase I [Lachnospiraceae bacterium]|nr:signal peptidase I [Lachnospiraceae bacterium]